VCKLGRSDLGYGLDVEFCKESNDSSVSTWP